MRNVKNLVVLYQFLRSFKNVLIPFQNLENKRSAYHIYPIMLAEGINRETVFNSMKEKGIQTSIHYPSLKSFTAYKDELSQYQTPNCDRICVQELTLPLYPTMTKGDVRYVVENFRKSPKRNNYEYSAIFIGEGIKIIAKEIYQLQGNVSQ